ncbi:hypothetical protein EMIT047CA2_230028 [Pseudomonas soli]
MLLAKQGSSGRFDGPFLLRRYNKSEIHEWNKQMKKYDL